MSGSFLSVEEARSKILDAIIPLGKERVQINDGFGRILAEPIISPVDWPRFDNSAMDGFALRFEDVSPLLAAGEKVFLSVVGEVLAGAVPTKSVGRGEAIRIMTGAPLPSGADTVVMREDTEMGADGRVEIRAISPFGANIRRRGGDVQKGQHLFDAGIEVDAGVIGLLASFARSQICVWRRPRVAILSTGDELVELDQVVGEGQIVNSSSYMIAAQVRAAGGIPVVLPIARDNLPEIEASFQEGLRCADMVLSIGGVSMGDRDLVKDVISGLNEGIQFWKVAMKPGKPLAFGMAKDIPLIGLPGNPVSSFVTFLQFVLPAIKKASGMPAPWKLPRLKARLTKRLKGPRWRPEFVRGYLSCEADGSLSFTPFGRQGSGNVHSVAVVNALGCVPAEVLLEAGSMIDVEPFAPLRALPKNGKD